MTEKSIKYHLNRIKIMQKELSDIDKAQRAKAVKDWAESVSNIHIPQIKKMKEKGNLTARVMLRALNCEFNKNKVTLSVKELVYWFETGQHLKEWKEIDTI